MKSQNPWWINAAGKQVYSVAIDPAAEPKPDLAAQLATRVFGHIEISGTLILQDVEREIREGLAVLKAPEQDEALRKAAQKAFNEVMAHCRLPEMPNCFVDSMRDLDKALNSGCGK